MSAPTARNNAPRAGNLCAMASAHLDMVRRYYAATDAQDWAVAGDCVGSGYVFIDHTLGIVARTPEELEPTLADEGPWKGTSHLHIERTFETSEGALIVQAVRTGSLTGRGEGWRQSVSRSPLPSARYFALTTRAGSFTRSRTTTCSRS